jgi:exodeoxyribonuclease V alpha subunit
MVFLHSHGVGAARAVRIYKTYGVDAVQVMSENPYRLAREYAASASRPLTRSQ